MKILFVNPSLRNGSPTKYLPVGIASVMTYVASKGYSFEFLDVDINDLSDEEVEQAISQKPYDIVLTGTLVTHYKWMKWFTRVVRQHNPKALIVVGNSVASSIPEVFLSNSEADVAIMGEAEITVGEVLDKFCQREALSKIQGIAYRTSQGKIIVNERRKALKLIDNFPMIDWKFFDLEKYIEKSRAGAEGLIFEEDKPPTVMPVVSARGCVFRCTFCHFVFWNDPYRYRTPESIIEEIEKNVQEYDANYINFWDDLSFGSLQQAERLADALIEAKLPINWSASVRTDLFGNPKYSKSRRQRVAAKFKESGCLSLGFSLESANEEILEMMEKRVKKEYFLEQVRILDKCGITSSVSIVFGYPLETKETITETFEMCKLAGVYPSIGYLLPLPATKMYEYAKEKGYIVDEDKYLDEITERQDLCLNMTTMSDKVVLRLIKDGASQLNSELALGLADGSLIKTGGYRNHTKKTSKFKQEFKRNENDVSFNYSTTVFHNELDKTSVINRGASE
tara:strand:- start:11196 stop:12725 length:1530 start_codon:yes stop_codon:yes gene_type:complete